MNGSIIRTALVASLLVLSSRVGHAAQAPQPSTSPALAEIFLAAKSACDARRHAECIARAREALASPRKSADDVYAANYYIMIAAQKQNDVRTMVEAMEGMLGSGFNAGPAATNRTRGALASAHFQLKNYAQAIRHGTELIRAGAADDVVYNVVGQSYYLTRNFTDAIQLFGGLVDRAEKARRKPDRQHLSLLYAAYDKAGNAQAAQSTLEKLVRYYPTSETWLVLLYELKRENLERWQKPHLYRLMESTGNLKLGADVTAYYEAATYLGLHAEAHRVLEAGLKDGAFAKSPEPDRKRAERYVETGRATVAAARGKLSELEAQARTAPGGDAWVTLGKQQFGFEMYPQAISSLGAGIAKGGVANLIDAQMTLGIAQLKAGRKADAVSTFRAIQGGDAVTQRLVKFWTLHAQ